MAISTTTCQQRAYDFIKAQITDRGFRPGEYITDTRIAKGLNISRTPVREAFHRLEKEGLLVSEPRHGWRVHTLTLKDINEIFDIKEVVEGMAARKAAGCADCDLRVALKGAVDDMSRIGPDGDTETWVEADHRFHDVIFAMADNARVCRIIWNLNDQWNRVRIGFTTIRSRVDRANTEHKAIMDAILAGDAEEAERQTQAHFRQVREELIHVLVNMVLPFVDAGV
jgi:DNA-binding GntR family transcriptional regulator